MVSVWSEVDPALTSYTDCTYCSVLMVLDASGFTAFPLGIRTHAERVAFRGGDTRLNFFGPVTRASMRYGVAVETPAAYSQAGLQAALSAPGKAFAVAGQLGNFPAGHPIRRHDPGFTGFHAVCVIPQGGGQVLWLDPLAPMGYAGDLVAASDVTDIFCITNYPNDARYLPTLDDDMNLKGTPVKPVQNRKTFLTAGGYLVADPTAMPYTNIVAYQPGQVFVPTYLVKGNTILGTDEWYGGFESFSRGQPLAFGYLSLGLCGPLEVIENPPDPVPPTPEPPDPIPLPDVDVALALAELTKQTVALNDASRAITRARTHKNNAKAALT